MHQYIGLSFHPYLLLGVVSSLWQFAYFCFLAAGGYRDALRFRPGEQITFDPDAFVLSRPASMHPFLEQMLQLQIFEQFINERLDMLNAGEGFQDEFEMEANLWADKWGTKSRYREWLNDMKVRVKVG